MEYRYKVISQAARFLAIYASNAIMSKRSIDIDEQERIVSAKTDSHSVPAVATSEEQDAPMNELEEQVSDEFDSDGEIIEIDGDDEINDEDDLKKKQEQAETLVQKDQSEGTKRKFKNYTCPQVSPASPDEFLRPSYCL